MLNARPQKGCRIAGNRPQLLGFKNPQLGTKNYFTDVTAFSEATAKKAAYPDN